MVSQSMVFIMIFAISDKFTNSILLAFKLLNHHVTWKTFDLICASFADAPVPEYDRVHQAFTNPAFFLRLS